ncbi:hypothetical protein GIB67_005584 [Kingdonia uniflora]|uniref:Uncharacterized protein n=1 Tax=Kingdonia uniflora TaxID=39325 RepID=A0A7J7LXQ7_9MAGN|nr:hypothetical protein GIB67_005584 [Kingdonia uniflora]
MWRLPRTSRDSGRFHVPIWEGFTARAAELRNTCGVNPKIIQKLSTRQPSYESRLKVLNEIASENSIVLHLDEEQSSVMLQEKMDLNQKQNESLPSPSANSVRDDTINLTEEVDRDEKLSGSLRARKYRNVASAAQAAFESAANAADAARAAVELSRFGSQDYDRDVESSLTPRKTNQLQGDGSSRKKIGSRGSGFEKIAPIETFDSESECEELTRNRERIRPEEVEEKNKDAEIEKWISSSSSDSDGDTLTKTKICSSISGQTKSSEEIISFENSDNETGNNHGRVPWLKNYDLGINGESTLPSKNFPKSTEKKLMRLNIERPLSVRTKRGNGQ